MTLLSMYREVLGSGFEPLKFYDELFFAGLVKDT